ncbi:alpha/beta hydrolase [Candidatus Hodarchaeum mangrovi]
MNHSTQDLRIFYFYGFASSPQSDKAQFFKKKFESEGIEFNLLDYIPTKSHFSHLRVSILLEELNTVILSLKPSKIILFGSSFGAYLAAWLAKKNPDKIMKLILMAPALIFSSKTILQFMGTSFREWEETGYLDIFHFRYNTTIPLYYSFYRDLVDFPPLDMTISTISTPTLIFHGRYDEIIPIEWSHKFVSNNPSTRLYILESNHQLLDQKDEMWNNIRKFLQLNEKEF